MAFKDERGDNSYFPKEKARKHILSQLLRISTVLGRSEIHRFQNHLIARRWITIRKHGQKDRVFFGIPKQKNGGFSMNISGIINTGQ